MKKILFLFVICFSAFNFSWAQVANPVKWTFSVKKSGTQEYDLIATAAIEKAWCVYSQFLESNDGPIPTSFTFLPDANVQLVEKTKETGHKKEAFDEMFAMKIAKFEDEAIFTQHVKVNGEVKSIKGSLQFMTCNGEICLPPKDVPFEFKLK